MAKDNGTSRKGGKESKKSDDKDGKKGKNSKAALAVAAPETVVGDGTPNPDYPRYRVKPGDRIRLKDYDPEESEDYDSKEEVLPLLQKQVARIDALQERLFAEGKQSLLVVLQAMDTGGKDGTIRGVFEG